MADLHVLNTRYDHRTQTRAGVMIDEAEVADLRRRLADGENLWLPVTTVGRILDVTRGTIHNRIKAGVIRTERKAGGPQLLCNPDDVRKLIPQRLLPPTDG